MEQRIPRTAFLTLLAGSALLLATAAAAQEAGATSEPSVAERCRPATYHQFDFWLGEWEVRNEAGEVIGHNSIRSVSDGCALLESWHGAGGGTGMSLNTWDPDRGAWTQRWVGGGSSLWMTGGMKDGSMELTGTGPRRTPQGDVLDRLTWTPLPDGRVRQVWEVSSDGGQTWKPAFVGLYSRGSSR